MSIFFNILCLLAGLVGLFVLLSYAIAWYEAANLRPELIEGRFRPANLLLASRLVVMESCLVYLTLLMHPFGWLLPEEKNRQPGNGPPLLLLHGLFHNRMCWWWVKLRLRRLGWTDLHSIYLPPWRNEEVLTEQVAKKIDALRHARGIEKVNLVGHSMGGILARNYLQLRGGKDKVARLVMLGSPNHGSKLAPFAMTRLGRPLMPGSAFLQKLNAAPFPEGVPVNNIFTRHDNLVVPSTLARVEGIAEIELAGLGHVSLLYHPRAFASLVQALEGGTNAHH